MLPLELLIHIFSFFESPKDIVRAGGVSTDFYQASTEDGIFDQCVAVRAPYPIVDDRSSFLWVAKGMLGKSTYPLDVVFSGKWKCDHLPDVVSPHVEALYIIVKHGAEWPPNIRQCYPNIKHVTLQSGSLKADAIIDAFQEEPEPMV